MVSQSLLFTGSQKTDPKAGKVQKRKTRWQPKPIFDTYRKIHVEKEIISQLKDSQTDAGKEPALSIHREMRDNLYKELKNIATSIGFNLQRR